MIEAKLHYLSPVRRDWLNAWAMIRMGELQSARNYVGRELADIASHFLTQRNTWDSDEPCHVPLKVRLTCFRDSRQSRGAYPSGHGSLSLPLP